LAGWSLHTKRDWDKEDEDTDDYGICNTVNSPRELGGQLLGEKVEEEAKDEDGKVESWVVMMDIGDSAHHDEWDIMESPTDQWIESVIVPFINILLGEVFAASLPPEKIDKEGNTEESQGSSAAPVNDRITQQKVLDDVIIPRAHSETDV
jgi:hypothetical protein